VIKPAQTIFTHHTVDFETYDTLEAALELEHAIRLAGLEEKLAYCIEEIQQHKE
jgi:hypothetical protein